MNPDRMIFKRDCLRDLRRKRAFGRFPLDALDAKWKTHSSISKWKRNGRGEALRGLGPSIKEADQKDASERRDAPADRRNSELGSAECGDEGQTKGGVRVVVLVERMTDDQCANNDPLGTGDPYWHRLWHPDLSPCSVREGPTYVVAPDLTRLVQVHLALDGATPIPQIGACAIDVLADEELPDIEGVRAYVTVELAFQELPLDLEQHLERLPFKAYRVAATTPTSLASASILDFDWSDVLPNLEWRQAA